MEFLGMTTVELVINCVLIGFGLISYLVLKIIRKKHSESTQVIEKMQEYHSTKKKKVEYDKELEDYILSHDGYDDNSENSDADS